MSENAKIIDEFAFYKLTVQNRSKLTVEQYVTDITLFSRFLIAKQNNINTTSEDFANINVDNLTWEFFKDVSIKDVYDFFDYVANGRSNQASARARKLSSLRSFYKYMTVKRRYFENNPVKDIEAPATKRSLPKYLTEEECISLLEAIENDNESKNRIRDFCIVIMFLNCGFRLSELVGINLRDIDPEFRSVRVVGKGSKERIVYLNDACRSAMTSWMLHRGQIEIIDKNALFISSRGHRISVKTVQAMVYKYLEKAGLGYRKLSVHKLRHTAATLMYQTGKVDVRALKDILGHEQLNTTQIYTHVSNQALENAMDQNPLAHVKRKNAKINNNDGDDEES